MTKDEVVTKTYVATLEMSRRNFTLLLTIVNSINLPEQVHVNNHPAGSLMLTLTLTPVLKQDVARNTL